ncbi:MAG: transcription antitermination factor NusB, partial [Candidatus Sulfotelmatobacter sp.]
MSITDRESFLSTHVIRHTGDLKPDTPNRQAVVSPARTAAFDILFRVERESSYASELLHSRTYNRLTTADHALATELVFGVLRWRSLLDLQIAGCSAQPLAKLDLEAVIALRLGLYQLRWLSRVPARAAIYESVELVKRARKRSAASFVNAVLRKLAQLTLEADERSPDEGYESVESIAHEFAHPRWLVERWAREYGIETVRRICRYNQSVPATAIRLRRPDADKELQAEGIDLKPGGLLAAARLIQHSDVTRGDVTKSRAFRAGLCVIQDEASQLVAAVAGGGARVLDCCASPGGKTLAMADHNPDAQIVAVDLHPHRTRLLRKLLRIGDESHAAPSNIRVLTADARNLPFAGSFDRVLADVPCSGTGTLARNPEIKWRLKPEDLADLQQRQVAILRSTMAQVAPRGRLIYSTCSLEREENEDVIERALAGDTAFRVLDCRAALDVLRESRELIWNDSASLTRGPY